MVGALRIQLISIVDDDESVREATTSLLRSVGFEAKSFSTAEKFLSSPFLQDAACLIVDVRMPGLSGPELQRRCPPRIAKSQSFLSRRTAMEESRRSLCERAPSIFLPKPFSEEALLCGAVWFGKLQPAANLFERNNQQTVMGNKFFV